jgi:galactosamine-6-phosphate isomerase
MSQHAADWLLRELRHHPDALICLAAGSTPVRTYELLAERSVAQPALFARCRLLKLDEWGGLEAEDPGSCEHQLQQLLVTPLGLADRYTAFACQPADPVAECARIADWLRQRGPIDVCVLGLGTNGHLGFNEPAETLVAHAHVAELAASSLGHAMLHRSHHQPTYGLTLGMADLLMSRQVLLLVSGASKQVPLEQLLNGRISTRFPASFLQLHSAVTLLCDTAARGDDGR